MLPGTSLGQLLAVNNIYLPDLSASTWASLKDPWEERANNHTQIL